MSEIKRYFISGIGTDVGKTIVSAVLVEALEADYWKPIQAGDLNYSDKDKVRALVANEVSVFHPNIYALKTPVSPHDAAKRDGIQIELENIQCPQTSNHLIIEGAGGLLVPINANEMVVDMIKPFNSELILVMNNYLGSINHTLLSLAYIKSNDIPLKGVIICGEPYTEGEDLILSYSGVRLLGRIPWMADLNQKEISRLAEQFKFLAND